MASWLDREYCHSIQDEDQPTEILFTEQNANSRKLDKGYKTERDGEEYGVNFLFLHSRELIV